MRKIPFGTLKINDISKQHVMECLENNYITMGPKVEFFEKKWAQLFDYPYTVAFSSGTSALTAACISLYDFGARPGDGIICPALSFIATANAIRAAGFTPIFVDVKHDLQIDETLIEKTIEDTKSCHICAIMGVNLMGKPCDMDMLRRLADSYKLRFIIDNCEAYGCQLNNKYSLEYADMEITSHYTAHITQSCEMGTVSVNTRSERDILKSIRNHGRQPDSLYFDHIRYGLNLKPTDLHASIGLGQIDDFWKIFNRRKEILKEFNDIVLRNYSQKFWLVLEDDYRINAPHAFSMTLRFHNQTMLENLKSGLEQYGIEWKRNFQCMPHSPAFHYLNDTKRYPIAEYISDWGIHTGCSDLLSDDDVEYVCETLENIFKNI